MLTAESCEDSPPPMALVAAGSAPSGISSAVYAVPPASQRVDGPACQAMLTTARVRVHTALARRQLVSARLPGRHLSSPSSGWPAGRIDGEDGCNMRGCCGVAHRRRARTRMSYGSARW